jgi:hypothetical protein
MAGVESVQSTFGRSGHTRSQRLCSPVASRFGQSAFSISRHFIMLPHAAVLLDQLVDVIAALAVALRAFFELASMSPDIGQSLSGRLCAVIVPEFNIIEDWWNRRR